MQVSASPRRCERNVAHTYVSSISFALLFCVRPHRYMTVWLWFPPQLLSLYCAGFLCVLIALSPPVADQNHIAEFCFLPFLLLPAARMHTWHRLTSLDISVLPHFNINCLPEEKLVWRWVATFTRASVCEQELFFPSLSLHSYRSLHRAAWNCLMLFFTSVTLEETAVWMCSPFCLGWGTGTTAKAGAAAAIWEPTCWRTFALPRPIIMTQMQFKDAFWVSERFCHVSSTKYVRI